MLSFALSGADRTNISLAAPLMTKDAIGLTALGLGVLSSAFFWTYAPMQIPGGLIGQFISPKKILIVCAVCWGGATFLTSYADSFGWLIAARVLLGLAEGATFPTYIYLMSRWFPRSERGRATSLLYFAGYGGGLGAGPLTGWLISSFGWRPMFRIEGLATIVIVLAFIFCVSDSPAKSRGLSETERSWITGQLAAEKAVADELKARTGAPKVRWYDLIRIPKLWAGALIYGAPGFAAYGATYFLPTIIKELSGINIGAWIGFLSSVPLGIGMVLVAVNGRVSDHFRRRLPFCVPHVIIGCVLLICAAVASGTWLKIGLLFAALGLLYSSVAPAYAFGIDSTPVEYRGLAAGFINVFYQASGAIAPIALGAVIGTGKAVSGLWILGIIPIAMITIAVVTLAVSRTMNEMQAVQPVEVEVPAAG